MKAIDWHFERWESNTTNTCVCWMCSWRQQLFSLALHKNRKHSAHYKHVTVTVMSKYIQQFCKYLWNSWFEWCHVCINPFCKISGRISVHPNLPPVHRSGPHPVTLTVKTLMEHLWEPLICLRSPQDAKKAFKVWLMAVTALQSLYSHTISSVHPP